MFLRLCAKLNFSKRNRHGRLEKHDEQLNLSPSTKARDHVVANHDVEVSSTQEAESTSQRANLWEVAGEKLNENDRKALGLERPLPITDALESVLKSTEEKYREYKKGGLKIRKRDGGHINVRDSAKSIILHALQAQDLVTRLVSFDPTGHASSAWSVVSIGLSIIKNDIERRDEIFHAAEYLAGILSYYAIVDNHYRERKAESDEGLEDALVEVYTAVLQYTVEVKKAENESKAARTLKSITALVQKPFKELKEAVEKKEQAVRKWADLTEALDRREQAEGMLDVIDKAIEELKIIQSHTRSLQDREILDWLSTASFSDPHNNTQGHRASNTGNWFLNLPEYKEWKITPGKICWLYGAVIQDIEEFCRSDPSRKFAYWYFQFSNDETQKVYNMIRSILRQFMPRALPASIIKLWEEHCNRGSKPQLQKFADILDIVLGTSQSEFFLILDALDECPVTGNDERRSLLQFLEELLEKHRIRIHILATSRPEPDIRSRLERYQSVDMELGLGQDVETFVRAQVTHGRLREWGESVKRRILEKLLDIPERRFRWADLQIRRLEKSKTEDALHKALDSIPVTLEDTYKDTLERLSEDDRQAARTILIWLSFSAVPMDLKTVAAVVSFRFPEDVVTTCTTSLVTVSISDDTVRLAHFSVKEFLVRNEVEGHWYQFSVMSGHEAIANRTIDCLLENTEILTKTTAGQQPLLIYAAKYWDHHLAELRDLHAKPTGLQEKVDRLFTERDVYFNWVRLASFERDYKWYQSFEELQPPLSSASQRGLISTVETLLAKGADPLGPPLDSPENTLLAAASENRLEVLQLLLNKVDEIPRRMTGLMLMFVETTEADKGKLANMLDLLWDKGALRDRSRASHRIIDSFLVESAAHNVISGHIVISCFLDRKEKMGVKITEKLLKAVLENGICGEKIMHLLLSKCDADIKLTPSLMRDLMKTTNSDAAIAVLKRRMNDFVLDEQCVGAFARGEKEAMELLLRERGEEIQVTRNVLITTAKSTCDPQTFRLLLSRRDTGAAIDKEVLLAAAGNRLIGSEIMEVLLDECGQDTVIDGEIIQEVVQNRNEGLGMMKTLLRRQQVGFVVTEQILCTAAANHSREMLELLVNNAGDSDIPITGKTLRSVADNFVHGQTLIEYLFELRGDSLPISDDVLVSIADGEHSQSEYVLTFILERWPDFPVTDRLLEAACTLPSTMSLLLDRRCDSLPIEKMIHKITNDRMHGAMVLKMLLDRQLVDVDEGLVETVAGGSHALDVIYRKKPDFPVTPKIVVKAARDCGALRILLDRQKNQALITEEVVKASLSGFHPYESINLLLTRLEPEAVPITEDILIYAIKTKILNQNIRALRLLLEQRRDLNLSTVWEAMWQDTELNPFTLAQAAGVLFQYAYFDVSFEMLEMFPSVFQHEWFTLVYPFDGFIRVCMQHRVPLPTTEAAVELIVERASLNTIDIFLEDHPDIPITEKYIEAAKRNPGEDVHTDELVSLLLSTRSRAS
ncbi:hypothetical protein CBS115989_562 [Aspergillus niger]|nr:hypothetical protein CBS115989_562 [Aspergillus niger]KAI2860631.1 hypothetical protein CBS11232_1481 [Aspergillus niger]KAI2881053.1 hypothetical protein CBS115988_915 [Aspergillus niger]KAI2900848.1 hypothetical protein CBS11852_2908 [Aspergillus niger]